MKKKKIYMSGVGGMLGKAFYETFNNDYDLKCTDIDLNEDWLSYLDFRDLNKYMEDVISFNPDFLFHIGAFTDLEFCEKNIDNTFLTNTISVENAVIIAKKLNIPLLYISTAGIFDGKQDYYNDWDIPNPLGIYGKSKYYGELIVQNNLNDYLICRAGWMMGGGPKKDKKFISKILNQIRSGKSELFIVDDKFGTPTYTNDFANQVKYLIENRNWGLYNTVCGGQTSRLEVTKEIIAILNLQNKIKLNVVTSSYFKNEYFAERPLSEQLINYKLNLRNINKMRNWKVSLKEYLTTEWI